LDLQKRAQEEWKEALITSIYRKGKVMQCETYGGINFTNIKCNIYAKILRVRLRRIAQATLGWI
jgi:ribosomal protein S26